MTISRDLVFANGRTVRVKRIEGEVLHADRKFQTHVTSSGGGGVVGPQGGYVAAPTVTSHTSQEQEIYLRLKDGTETSFWFRNWSIPVRPGSRLAVLLYTDSGSGQEVILAARNMDINAERWVDVRAWAQGKGLLAGKMRVWPSALLAGLIAAAFVALRTSALATQGAKTEPLTDWMLVAAIAFVPVVVMEWLIAIVARATDTEPGRIANELESYLRTG